MSTVSTTVYARQDGNFIVPFVRSDVAKVTLLDIDMVVTLVDGRHIVLVGAALAAMSAQPPSVGFSDGSLLLASQLLQMVAEFSTKAAESSLASQMDSVATGVAPGADSPVMASADQTEAETLPAEDTTPGQPLPPNLSDSVEEAMQAIAKQGGNALVQPNTTTTPEDNSGKFTVPPERPGSIPVVLDIVGPSEFRGVVLYNVTGQRQEGQTIYGSGGDAYTGSDASLEAQAAAEFIKGTSANDVLYGDDPQALGSGFAKLMALSVDNARKVDSFTIEGLADEFAFEGATKDAAGVWRMDVPIEAKGADFDGTYEIINKILYPTDLAVDSSGFAISNVFRIELVATDLAGEVIRFSRTVTLVVKDVQSASDLLLGPQGSDFTLILPARGLPNIIEAGDGDDTMYGASARDVLDGGSGADLMVGRQGDDTYIVDNVGDSIVEMPSEGSDQVYASVSYTLSSNVENLTITGSATQLLGIGNELANVIKSNDAGSLISGMGGRDILIGGASSDTLDGGEGVDTMSGGLGDDTYIVDDASDLISEQAGAGIDVVVSSSSYVLSANLERLTLSGGLSGLAATGNAGSNVLTANDGGSEVYGLQGDDTLIGGRGDDTLDGGQGPDSMVGGEGDDTYYIDDTSDVVTELSNGGSDLIVSSISLSLNEFVENLTLVGSANLNASGNAQANAISGNSGANALEGGGR